ncbi:hypothetical protein A2810_00460 [candidate division Kazan bacterium RIFCSPHIGHO2_01_FULL_49_10]|uniref:Uncharacterized protein n=1 Tax=candidate division Kazan bacterium RIFCSPLOWO2_01_FULL_48_13 TaxID=1798539 RepID=A0A1F4PPK8_UNCK3|nr:MAG: hypothetical protein A2810_00460 [candidate division Kazan bacterium RIFCSPHIGHO2_01_FULL_49_10]OGB85611.1 MAG: hypothetical protein A2994_01170 [candidate division Kazan bacterium RIFCSPLOWO2_01_FULL_48_13]
MVTKRRRCFRKKQLAKRQKKTTTNRGLTTLVYTRKELSEDEKKKLSVDRILWRFLLLAQKALLMAMFLGFVVSAQQIIVIAVSQPPIATHVLPVALRLLLVLIVGIYLYHKIPDVMYTHLWPKWGNLLERD